MRAEITTLRLADIVDTIAPIGSMVIGSWQQNAPLRCGKKPTA